MPATEREPKNPDQTFAEYFGVPSAVVTAMCDGLEAMDKAQGFEIDMSTFGSYGGGICFGCAATCTIQVAAGRRFGAGELGGLTAQSLPAVSEDSDDLSRFERAVDRLRKGYYWGLEDYFDLPTDSLDPDKPLPAMFSEKEIGVTKDGAARHYLDAIPAYREYAEQLQEKGF